MAKILLEFVQQAGAKPFKANLVRRFFFQAEDGIRDGHVTGVQTCALPICQRRETDPEVDGRYSSSSWIRGTSSWNSLASRTTITAGPPSLAALTPSCSPVCSRRDRKSVV